MTSPRLSGPPRGSAAPELVESGFALENADAPFLHDGLNLADIAHVIDLRRRGLIPESAARDLQRLLLEVHATDVAGWLHAGRPRREAARIALRLYVRRQLLELVDEVASFARDAAELASRHV